MSNDPNQVVLFGNLTRDPELRKTPKGKSVVTLGLAHNESYKENDEWKSRPNFIDIDVWGTTAEKVTQKYHKGTPVLVVGRLRYESWEDEGGNRRSKVKLVANIIGKFIPVYYKDEERPADATEPASVDDDDIPY